ncbi:conserved protein, unknown function [Hepatocystis sp. ex Piliocolobus tephrosceles]|nr:conserved protein, unknown function [Hepatocystis sp. ex Piliocolobus tephrosceles]
MELSIDSLKEKFLNMNNDIELIERKLKDEMCKMYEDEINPFLIITNLENVKHELIKINKGLHNLYERKKKSIYYMHRQMQNYNFLLTLEHNLNIDTKKHNNYKNSEIILNNFFYDNIKNFLLNINYDEIKELINLNYTQKYFMYNKEASHNEQLNSINNDTKGIRHLSADYSDNKPNTENDDFEENKKKIINNGTNFTNAIIPANNNSNNQNNAKGINTTGINTTGINAKGVNAKGVNVKGVNAKGVNVNDKSSLFRPIDEATFQKVPLLIKRRAKLEDINLIYKALFDIAIKRGSCLPVEKSELTQMNLQVFGQTGEAKIATLRYLKIIEVINRTSSIKLLNCEGLKKKKKKTRLV